MLLDLLNRKRFYGENNTRKFHLCRLTFPRSSVSRTTLASHTLHSSVRLCSPVLYYAAGIVWEKRATSMSGSTSPPPTVEAVGTEGCFPPGYKPFKPEEHGLERGFRLTSFSELKG